MPAFAYHRPESLDEALELLAEYGEEAKVLAGGQSLLPIMSLRLSQPGNLIDIGRIPELDRIVTVPSGGVAIGATVRHTTAEQSESVRAHAPMVCEALPHVGHRAIRSRGTVVGSLAHADPAAELPAVALALGARFAALRVDGRRTIAVSDFFQGFLTTALEADELLLGVEFASPPPRTGHVVKEVTRRHGDFAILGIATQIGLDHNARVSRAALSFFGAASTPVRVERAERLLVGEEPSITLFAEAAEIAKQDLEPPNDAHGTSAYRKHLAGVLVQKSLIEAVGQIGGSA